MLIWGDGAKRRAKCGKSTGGKARDDTLCRSNRRVVLDDATRCVVRNSALRCFSRLGGMFSPFGEVGVFARWSEKVPQIRKSKRKRKTRKCY